MRHETFDVAVRLVRVPGFFMFLGYAYYVLTIQNQYDVEGLRFAGMSFVVVLWLLATVAMEARAVIRDLEARSGGAWYEGRGSYFLYGLLMLAGTAGLTFGYYGLR